MEKDAFWNKLRKPKKDNGLSEIELNNAILDLKFFMESFKSIINPQTRNQMSQIIVKILKEYEDINEVDQEDVLKVYLPFLCV